MERLGWSGGELNGSRLHSMGSKTYPSIAVLSIFLYCVCMVSHCVVMSIVVVQTFVCVVDQLSRVH